MRLMPTVLACLLTLTFTGTLTISHASETSHHPPPFETIPAAVNDGTTTDTNQIEPPQTPQHPNNNNPPSRDNSVIQKTARAGSNLVLGMGGLAAFPVLCSVGGSIAGAYYVNKAVWKKGNAWGITPLQAIALPVSTASGAAVGAVAGPVAGAILIYIFGSL